MAILALGASRCSICGEVLHPAQAIVATTHFIADQADPLWRFSDTGMHATCFEGWEHRDEFAARHYAALGRTMLGWVPAVPTNTASSPMTRSRLAVLGTPEDRAGYFEELEARIAQHAEPSDRAESW